MLGKELGWFGTRALGTGEILTNRDENGLRDLPRASSAERELFGILLVVFGFFLIIIFFIIYFFWVAFSLDPLNVHFGS